MSVISLLSRLKESGVRIRLADDKLKLHAPKGRLSPDLLNELKQRREQVIDFLRTLEEDDYAPIEPVEKKEYYELSSAQKRLYFIQRLLPESAAYNMPMNVLFPLDSAGEGIKARLESVFKRLISRHESFRTSFEAVNGQPVQRIHDVVEFGIEYLATEVTEDTEKKKKKTIETLQDHELPIANRQLPAVPDFICPFDLSKAPLLRARLVNTGETKFLLMIDMHHIISDGTSHDILRKEFLILLYRQKPGNLKLQYKDYSEWQNSGPQREWINKQEPYWLREFSGELPVLRLPIDNPRPLIQGFEGAFVHFELNTRKTRILKDIAQENDATLYMILLAVFNVLFSKLSGQEDIIVGSPIAARPHHDLQGVIGMLVNTLAMRNYPVGNKTFREFLKEVKHRTLKAYENQEYPFEELVDKISVNRDTGRNPVFDVMLNLLNQGDYHYQLQVMRAKSEKESAPQHHEGFSRFDMTIYVIDLEEQIHFNIEYSTKLFKPAAVEGFFKYFKNIVSLLPANINGKLADIEMITSEEKKAILEMSGGVEEEYDAGKTTHRLFEEQAARTPGHTAVIGAAQLQITYGELNKRSDQLAFVLRQKGVGPDSVVGIMVHRSLELIIGILGILKAGGAYLPIDADYPRERIDFMLKDSNTALLLTSEELSDVGSVGKGTRFCAPTTCNLHLSLAYVIYTSGSTGKPKGVMLEHRTLVNLIRYQFSYTAIDFRRVLQFTTITFDVSAQEIFSTLLAGGTLVLAAKETIRDISRLLTLMEKEKIKTVFWPASFLKFVMNEEAYVRLMPGSLQHIVTAGEQVIVSGRFRRYLEDSGIYFHNHYGPSETHVVTAWTWRVGQGSELAELPPIGGPVLNTSIYLLGKGMNLVPVGVPGELYIGGLQVGRGYLNNPQLTAERFIYRSYRSYRTYRLYFSKKLYKTGDLARWLPDGNIEFLGRIDLQVKVRGFRVELGEIENQLLNCGKIKDAVVLAREDQKGDKYLCAYVVSDKGLELSQLREYLLKHLPDYMIPAYFVQMDKIPLTASGKVDRGKLPRPREADIHLTSAYEAPETGLQRIIAETWKEVLDRDKVGTRDNFFDLGGNSLDFITVSNKLKEILKKEIPVVTLFTYPTIGSLENYLNRDGGIAAVESGEPEPSELIDEGKDLMRQTLKKMDEKD